MLIYFMAIWNIFWTFGIFYDHLVHLCVHLVHYFPFWYLVPRNIWQPCLEAGEWRNRRPESILGQAYRRSSWMPQKVGQT
jgi:hypothetical protein